jgi:hypothetical protein
MITIYIILYIIFGLLSTGRAIAFCNALEQKISILEVIFHFLLPISLIAGIYMYFFESDYDQKFLSFKRKF